MIVIDGGPRVPGMDAGARKVVPFLCAVTA